jgi:diadenosine tetraphosphatase ApaH/serine/threonine PP2A family protein phosphatase
MDFLCRLPRTVREENTLFVHGSPRGPTNEYVMPEDIQNSKKMEKLFSLVPRHCFQGHTHVPGVFTTDLHFHRPGDLPDGFDVSDPLARFMINVGSVGQPRDLDPRSCYVVYDQQRVVFHRVEYDIEKTIAEIEAEAELDNFLGYRLRDGR